MKKVFCGLVILLVSLVIITTSNPAVFANGKVPVTISFWFPGADGVSNDYFVGAAKEFEKIHPQINVAVNILPTTAADIDLKLNAALLSGTFPDVFVAYLNFIGTRGPLGDFLPLNSYINKWPDRSDIYKNAIETGMYKNKQILGLGFYPAPEILTYRKDFFKEAGLNPENPPKTWEKLADYARKLTKRDSNGNVIRAGFDIPAINASVFFRPLMRQNGSLVVNEKKGVPAFTDKNSVEAWNFIIKLKNEKVSIPYNFQKSEEAPFMKGNAAISYLSSSQIATMLKYNPEMKNNLGYAPVLSRKQKVDFCGYRLLTIGSHSKYKKESWEFIKFMMTRDQMRKRYKLLNIPVVRKSLEAEFIADDPELNKIQTEYIKCGKGAENVPWLTAAVRYLHLAWEEAYNNKKTPAQALKNAEINLKKDLQSAK